MTDKKDKNSSYLKGGRTDKTVKVKTAKGRKSSSTRWLQRQLNDPYVQQAKADGYRSRAAYKLIEMDDKHHFLKHGIRVVDLGAAPGSWLQVAIERCGKKGQVIGLDLQEVEPIVGVELLQGDFTEQETLEQLEAMMQGKAQVVMSDMAAPASGHTQTDHIRIMHLCELALDFAQDWLEEGGTFLAKVLRGGAEQDLLKQMKRDFASVKHIKPQASRADSAEMYVIALGFKGKN